MNYDIVNGQQAKRSNPSQNKLVKNVEIILCPHTFSINSNIDTTYLCILNGPHLEVLIIIIIFFATFGSPHFLSKFSYLQKETILALSIKYTFKLPLYVFFRISMKILVKVLCLNCCFAFCATKFLFLFYFPFKTITVPI